MHTLDITYHDTGNCGTLRIEDNSTYDILQPVTNQILEVKPPGKSCYIPFDLTPVWCAKVMNCTDLQICCGDPTTSFLPDGIYSMKYSLDPNLMTIIEVDHLRVCQLRKSYYSAICELQSNKYRLTHKAYREEVDRLYYIRGMIDDSVTMVEECLQADRGMEIYEEAKKLLGYGCAGCR